MDERRDHRVPARSERVFRRLLCLYPRAHRAEYGAAMTQLFRDQCRDAWNESRGRGLAGLWLRVLPDLLKTSVIEHLDEGGRKLMFRNIGPIPPLAAAVVFALVVAMAALTTFLLPKSYASNARVLIGEVNEPYDPNRIRVEIETIKSEAVLGKVVETLDLNRKWGRQYTAGATLSTAESIQLLERMLDVRPVRNTRAVEIRAYSQAPNEAAEIANTVVQEYQASRVLRGMTAQKAEHPGLISDPMVSVIDRAVPNTRPVRPNVPLNLFLGVVVGLVAALVVFGLASVLTLLWRRRSTTPSSPA